MNFPRKASTVRLAGADDGLLLEDAEPLDGGGHGGVAEAPLAREGPPGGAQTSPSFLRPIFTSTYKKV